MFVWWHANCELKLGGVSSGYIVKIEDDQRTHVQFVTIHALTMEGASFDSLESLNSNEEYQTNL